jgi:hypothetical protein
MAEAGQTSAALGRYPAWLLEALALYGPFAREFSMMARELREPLTTEAGCTTATDPLML